MRVGGSVLAVPLRRGPGRPRGGRGHEEEAGRGKRCPRHSSAVGNTAPEVSLTRVAVTTRFAILKRDRNVEASSQRPPKTQVPALQKKFLAGGHGLGRQRPRASSSSYRATSCQRR